MNVKKREIGNIFEDMCRNYLEGSGYNILDTNYYSRYGEIDIIATNNKYLAFVEVKSRKKDSFIKAYEAVNRNKKIKIIKTAYKYLVDNNFNDLKLQPRFDICEIYFENNNLLDNKLDNKIKINYIKNAFDLNSVDLGYKYSF